MTAIKPLAFALLGSAAVLLAGCFMKKDEGQERATLQKGWQVSEEMKGWVAVAPSKPQKQAIPGKDWLAYRIATHNVIPVDLDKWFALSPETFKKYTRQELTPLNTAPAELWEMRVGRRVPPEKDGWIGVPLQYPEVVKKGSLGLASLKPNLLVPKEMDGWVCVSAETMAQLVSAFEMGKNTIQSKDGTRQTESTEESGKGQEGKKAEAIKDLKE